MFARAGGAIRNEEKRVRAYRAVLGFLVPFVALVIGCRPAPAPEPTATLELRRVYKTTATTIPLSEPKADEISENDN